MPVLLAALGALPAAAFRYCRLRDMGHAAGEILDAAQRVRGGYRRKQFRKNTQSSAVEAVDDPATAVAMLIVASERGALSVAAAEAIKAEMKHVVGLTNIVETFAFAKGVAGHATGPEHPVVEIHEALVGGPRAVPRARYLRHVQKSERSRRRADRGSNRRSRAPAGPPWLDSGLISAISRKLQRRFLRFDP